MLAQELFGLEQGCILGRMRCAYGLTTNGPDHSKLLCHLSFPRPMKTTIAWRNQSPEPGRRPTIRLIKLIRFSLSLRAVRSQEQMASQRELCSAIGQGESSKANLILEACALPPPWALKIVKELEL
jgi:hypothetical protein